MHPGAITDQFDVALLAVIIFFLFFVGLIYYLRMEDRREGYPLVSEQSKRPGFKSFAFLPKPKKYIMPHGDVVVSPRAETDREVAADDSAVWRGMPIVPTGEPMIDGVGAASYAKRADIVDMGFNDGMPNIMPLRLLKDYTVASEDADPRGMPVVGADGKVAGTVRDVWIDRPESAVRYLEVDVQADGGLLRVLTPLNLAVIHGKARKVVVKTILAHQFAKVPLTKSLDHITLLEEDRVTAYFGGGQLHATPARAEPLI